MCFVKFKINIKKKYLLDYMRLSSNVNNKKNEKF